MSCHNVSLNIFTIGGNLPVYPVFCEKDPVFIMYFGNHSITGLWDPFYLGDELFENIIQLEIDSIDFH